MPPGHPCRVDDLAYESVTDWFHDHYGRVPIQVAVGLDQHKKRTGSIFAEAFKAAAPG
jgi:hypothetical protein